jgi:putative membrane protein
MRTRFTLAVITMAAIAVSVLLFATLRVWAGNPANLPQQADQQKMEQYFFQDQASANGLEIRLAKLAQDQATDPQVKQCAQTMQQDHEQANQLLKQIADQHNIIVLMDKLTPVDQAILDKLQVQQGDMFTRCYVFQQVGAHAEAELTLAYQAHFGTDAPCRDYANQALPVVQKHLHMLADIARPMAGLTTAEAANSMTPGGK